MSSDGTSRVHTVLTGTGALAVLVLAAAFVGLTGLGGGAWPLALAVGGGLAVLLLGFPGRTIIAAVGHATGRPQRSDGSDRSVRVWEAAARNAWVLGALGACVAFVANFCSGFAKIGQFVAGLGGVAVSLTCGLGLAVLFSIPALRLSEALGREARATPGEGLPEPPARFVGERWLAYGFLALLLIWPLLSSNPDSPLQVRDWLLHWPALLVVAGGGLALAVYLGFPRNGRALGLGLASAGAVAALLGLTEGLRGFGEGSIAVVTRGLTLMVSACYATLVGLVVFGLPQQDRAAGGDDDARSRGASQVACYGFPFFVLVCLAITALLIMVPMERELEPGEEAGATTEAPVSRLGSPRPAFK